MLPVAVRGAGSWLFSADGRKFLDAAGQAAVINIGHGVSEIGRAMAEQSSQLAFAHTSQFHSPPAEKLATRLLALAPPKFRKDGRVYFTSGGSEATETAIKLVRQYHLEKGQPARYRILSRRQSYHGSTLGAMSVSGNLARRAPYQPLLAEWGHIAPCFCYHCPFEKTFPQCHLTCADDLDSILAGNDTASAAAFVFEPVVGATLGAAVPPEGYVARIAEICRERGILFIADEVMTGMGRTGKNFAVEHWDVAPDLMVTAKGLSSGYAPLGAVIVSKKVADAIACGSGTFLHGFTYNSHPISLAAGRAVLKFVQEHDLVQHADSGQPDSIAAMLRQELQALLETDAVGDVRGIGLLWAVELVADKNNKRPFDAELNFSARVAQAAMRRGLLVYPVQGCVDGIAGDHLVIAPPAIMTEEQIIDAVEKLREAIKESLA